MNKTRRFSRMDVQDIEETLREREDYRDLAMFLLGRYTGFRISELLWLDVCRVWDGDEFLERVTVPASATKNNKQNSKPLHPNAKRALREYLESRGWPDGDEPLFKSKRGGRLTRKGAWSAIQRACEKADVSSRDRGTHSLRKTFGWRVYEKHGIRAAQKALGHSKVTTTQEYLGVDEDEVDDMVLGLD